MILTGPSLRMRSFVDAGFQDNQPFIGLIQSRSSSADEFELGPMIYRTTGAGQVERGTPFYSSLDGASVNFSPGNKLISVVSLPAPAVKPVRIATATPAVMTSLDYELGVNLSIAGPAAVTLP